MSPTEAGPYLQDKAFTNFIAPWKIFLNRIVNTHLEVMTDWFSPCQVIGKDAQHVFSF